MLMILNQSIKPRIYFRKIKMKKAIYSGILLGILALAVALIIMYIYFIDITVIPDPANYVKGKSERTVQPQDREKVYFGVISRFSPRLIYEGYQPVMDYLNEQTPYHFELKLSDSYNKTIKQVHDGEVTFAFVGTYIYVKARKQYNISCLIKPLNREGQPFFRTAIVARKDNQVKSVKELAGERIAVPSGQSFSANWLAYYELPRYNIRIDNLDTLQFFSYHHTVIFEILKNKFDAGAVKDRVAVEFLNSGIKILEYSDPIPSSPIVMNKNADPQIAKTVKEALLKIDPSQDYYRELTQNWDRELIYGFQEAMDSDYDAAELLINRFGAQ